MKQLVTCFTTIAFYLLLSGCSSTPPAPPTYVTALKSITWAGSNPADQPGDWLLAHVDVETTGLVPGYHEMIDMGVIITGLEGNEIDRLFLRIMPDHPDRADPGAVAVNGFSIDLWRERGYVTTAEAVQQLVAFHNEATGDRQVLFTAFNAWFDISFVDHLFRSQGRTWRELYHYIILDLPSMAWSLGIHDLTGGGIAGRLALQAETRDPLKHTGATGVEFNVNLYRALLDQQKQ